MKHTAQIFKALADETRLRIMLLLQEHGELCVCDLMAALELPQSTISRHVAYLKNAGWLEGERRGVWMYYRPAEKQDGLQEEIRQALASHLPQTRQGSSDVSRLRSYMRKKNEDACK